MKRSFYFGMLSRATARGNILKLRDVCLLHLIWMINWNSKVVMCYRCSLWKIFNPKDVRTWLWIFSILCYNQDFINYAPRVNVLLMFPCLTLMVVRLAPTLQPTCGRFNSGKMLLVVVVCNSYKFNYQIGHIDGLFKSLQSLSLLSYIIKN